VYSEAGSERIFVLITEYYYGQKISESGRMGHLACRERWESIKILV
jgi:hypothetical protein